MSVVHPYPEPPVSYFGTTITAGDWLDGTYEGWCVDTHTTINPGKSYNANVYTIYEDLMGIVDKPNNLDAVNWLLNQPELEVGQSLSDDIVFGTYLPPDHSGAPLPSDYPDYPGTDPITGSTPGTGNNLGSITYGDIQRAIWALIEDTQSTTGLGSLNRARADELADRAYINGQGFIPDPELDQTELLVLQPVNDSGDTIAQVSIISIHFSGGGGPIPGEPREETAWGEGAWNAYGIGDQNDELVGGGTFSDSSWAMYSTIACSPCDYGDFLTPTETPVV